jgi:ubiquinone/menaquinone biosynthesis C-methylase UbiE
MSHAAPARIESWEAAYVRFETPDEEVRKFSRRLRRLGAEGWRKDSRILELFCGRGNGLVALEQLGFAHIRGVDLSERLVSLHHGRARCLVGDCRALPVRGGSQDIAIVQGGLHHLAALPDDLERVLTEVQRVLRPGGLFVVVEPWRTLFLDVVHTVGCSAVGRRLWRKMDALATMIEHESQTYHRWLEQPALISALLCDRFEPRLKQERLGKLMFVGRAPRT